MLCKVCEWRRVKAKGRCGTCLEYLRRTGRERPVALVVAHGRRVLERQQASKVLALMTRL